MSERSLRRRSNARGVAYATLRGCTAAILLALGLGLSACATNERLPAVPLSLAASAVPLEIADARYYVDGDTDRVSALATQAYMRAKAAGALEIRQRQAAGAHVPRHLGRRRRRRLRRRPPRRLDRARRPAGVRHRHRREHGRALGAVHLPRAGIRRQLRAIYTETGAGDIFGQRSFMAAVADDAMADSAPLANRIAGSSTSAWCSASPRSTPRAASC